MFIKLNVIFSCNLNYAFCLQSMSLIFSHLLTRILNVFPFKYNLHNS